MIAPKLRTSVWNDREQLVKLIGEQVIVLSAPKDGGPSTTHAGFKANGSFVRAGKVTPEGKRAPAHRRVSAVMVIERVKCFDAYGMWVEPRVVVVHNPNASAPMSPETFGPVPQFVREAPGRMAWIHLPAELDAFSPGDD